MTVASRRRWLKPVLIAVLVASIYPAWVLGYTWSYVLQSDLPGGHHGPLDAYRHTLASAVVSYTLGPRAVAPATSVLEFRGNAGSFMDRHNNRIGAAIGAKAGSLAEIEPAVRARVLQGAVATRDPQQTFWLPPAAWREATFW
ncbi:MAG: hypothetical protein H0X13_08300 [Ramlibacter sp.]|nr:hypothetical protein [Ramlibacter sp.]